MQTCINVYPLFFLIYGLVNCVNATTKTSDWLRSTER